MTNPGQPPVGPRLERPVFVVAPPCSGASRVAEALAAAPGARQLEPPAAPGEELLPGMRASKRGWDSDRLNGSDAADAVGERFRAAVAERLRDDSGDPQEEGSGGLRPLDADGRNALRVPFLDAVFPKSVFVYVYRDPRESIAAMIDGWESGAEVSHADLPAWEGPPWSYLLTPEWRLLGGSSIAEICARQWAMTTRILLTELDRLAPDRWCVVDHAALVADPEAELERLCGFAGLSWDPAVATALRSAAGEADDAALGRRSAEVEAVVTEADELAARARGLIASPRSEPREVDLNSPQTSPLRSVNSANLADILEQLGSSLMVTTYQTGKLVCVRRDGASVNTHFRQFESPMGLDLRGGRLAIGTRSQIYEYHDVPSVAAKLEPAGRYGACFIPRRSHYTGDVRIHELAYAGDELWFVNTRFSCLATLDGDHSFVPRWRPPFVTALAAEDRCHLNGMAVVGEEVRYVSMLGTSDEAGGWRASKASGGMVMDVPSSEPVATGLSMPHSPRWYRDGLWVLESGEGAFGRIDLDTGRVETVAKLPGFTRGLSFMGPLAFIGLSEVRESSTFGGLPLTGRLEERQCGVWVVNIETGETIAFLRFEDLVEEIFAVMVVPGIPFPEVAEHGSDAVNLTYVVPDSALAETA